MPKPVSSKPEESLPGLCSPGPPPDPPPGPPPPPEPPPPEPPPVLPPPPGWPPLALRRVLQSESRCGSLQSMSRSSTTKPTPPCRQPWSVHQGFLLVLASNFAATPTSKLGPATS